jgi:hypothetical protein
MKKNEKGDRGHGMYSDEVVATHAQSTLESLRQSELFTSLMQETEGNESSLQTEAVDHETSHQK